MHRHHHASHGALWAEAEAALEAITPSLWEMALATQGLLDVTPDRDYPRRAIRKPQVEGEVAVVLKIEGIGDAPPAAISDLRCRVGRQWSFPRRWLRPPRTPAWRDLAIYDLRDISGSWVHVLEDLRVVVASGMRTRSR